MKVLGNFVGMETYRREEIKNSIKKMSAALPALEHVEAQGGMASLQLCLNARPTFIGRVAEPEFILGP